MGQSARLPREMLRIIDANLNRTSEGLRVLEDVARMALDDGDMSARLKTMRHRLVHTTPSFHRELLESRDSEGDVGRDTEVAGEERSKDLQSVVVANSRRVQESLRVLEEMAKVPGGPPDLDAEKFKQMRFGLYSIEKALLSRLEAPLS